MAIIGYARRGADGETLDVQAAALKAAGAARVFSETENATGRAWNALARAIRSARAGDTVLVTRLRNLGGSMREVVVTLDAIARNGAGFCSLTEAWANTNGPQSGARLTVVRGLAEFERDLIRSRANEGRRRARALGQTMGRPPILDRAQRERAMSELAAGVATQADLARRYQVSQSTISRLAAQTAPFAARATLDRETEGAARAFLRRLAGRYPVREAIVFGSRARGAHKADSDVDVAVVLKGRRGDRIGAALDMAGIAFDVLLETGLLIEALPLWESELEHPEAAGNSALIDNIQREGVRL